MRFDVIGNVVDEKNKPIVGVVVDDGSQGVQTDINGYYEIKTDKSILNFRIIGFDPVVYDLSKKFKDNSSVNVDVVMSETKDLKNNSNIEVNEKKSQKKYLYAGFSAVALGGMAFLVSKKLKLKTIYSVASIIGLSTIGFFVGLSYFNVYSETYKKAEIKKSSSAKK